MFLTKLYKCTAHGRNKTKNAEIGQKDYKLYNTGFFERSVGAIFLNSFYGVSGKGESDGFFQFRNIDPLFLEVWISSLFPGWVKLCGASSV